MSESLATVSTKKSQLLISCDIEVEGEERTLTVNVATKKGKPNYHSLDVTHVNALAEAGQQPC